MIRHFSPLSFSSTSLFSLTFKFLVLSFQPFCFIIYFLYYHYYDQIYMSLNHLGFWFATAPSITLFFNYCFFILTPNGLSLINRALSSLSHAHTPVCEVYCVALNAESVIPWKKYKEWWASISWPGAFKAIPPPRHCEFQLGVIEKMKCCTMWMGRNMASNELNVVQQFSFICIKVSIWFVQNTDDIPHIPFIKLPLIWNISRWKVQRNLARFAVGWNPTAAK